MKKIRIILLLFNIIAAIGLIATTLAGAIAPSTSILPSVLAYGFLSMLLLNVVLVIVWLVMGRWEFLVSAGAILARISYIGLFFQMGGTSEVPSREEHPDMVVLMSYNLHHLGGNGLNPDPKEVNAQGLLQLLDENSPDILCLQEYSHLKGVTVTVTDSLRARGYAYAYGANGESENPRGTVVFSKLPITYVKKIDQQKILVEIQQGSRKFRLCCVHMDSYAFDANERTDIEKMSHGKISDSVSRRTLGKVKETVLQHEREWATLLYPVVTGSSLPFILAGDMNDIPSSWLYSQINDYLDDTYRDQGSGFGTTFNGGFPRFRIDMVFHSSHFTTLSHKRIKSDISDHYPVLVSLELKNEK